MISGKRVIAAMLTALMAVTFTANTAVSVYATGVTATENAQTIDAQSTDAQALTPEEQKAQELQQVYEARLNNYNNLKLAREYLIMDIRTGRRVLGLMEKPELLWKSEREQFCMPRI